ncbi:winged helix-turn-helix transcriptional regulator [Methanospirillum sp.]
MRILPIFLFILLLLPVQVMADRYIVTSAYEDLPDTQSKSPDKVQIWELPLWLFITQVVLLSPIFMVMKQLLFLGYRIISRNTLFESRSRRDIYEFIVQSPGIHLRGIASAMNMELGTVRYHLDQLARFSQVTKFHSGGFARYYPPGYSADEKRAINLTTSPSRHRIMLMLKENPGLTRQEIGDRLKISAQAAGWHLSQLLDKELIRKQKSGRTIKYLITEASDPAFGQKKMKQCIIHRPYD